MVQKIKQFSNSQLMRDLRDIRVIGFSVFGALVLLVTWSGVKVIETNYRLEQTVSKLQQQNTVLELENANQKLRNEYYNTDDFLELQARKQLGKAAPGETVLLIPKSVALSKTEDFTPEKTAEAARTTPKKPIYQQNLEAWRDYLLRRTYIVE